MELFGNYLILLHIIFLLLLQKASSSNSTENFQIVVPEKPTTPESHSSAKNKTIDKLVQEHTDLIKKIVSSHKATPVDYPIVTKKEVTIKDTTSVKEKEQQSIEELRIKCQELFKQFSNGVNKETAQERSETKGSTAKITTVEAFGPQQKPEFLQKLTPKLPPKFSSPTQVEQITQKQALNYFYITRNPTTIVNNSHLQQGQHLLESDSNVNLKTINPTTSKPPIQPFQYPVNPVVRYVQLEPVILQKMTLNDGKTLFYWYRNLPAPQYHSTPVNSYLPPVTNAHQTYSSQIINHETQPHDISNIQMESAQISNIQAHSQEHATSEKVSSVSPIPNNQNHISPENVPQYEIEYSTTKKSDQDLYNKQMKFVIPVPYPAHNYRDISTRYPWQFDPYAYYPKPLQPSTINVPLQYVPTFHMIRTLTIPKDVLEKTNERVATNAN